MFWSFFRSRAQGEIKRGGGGAEEDRGVRVVLGPPVVKKVRDQKWSGRLTASGEVPGEVAVVQGGPVIIMPPTELE